MLPSLNSSLNFFSPPSNAHRNANPSLLPNSHRSNHPSHLPTLHHLPKNLNRMPHRPGPKVLHLPLLLLRLLRPSLDAGLRPLERKRQVQIIRIGFVIRSVGNNIRYLRPRRRHREFHLISSALLHASSQCTPLLHTRHSKSNTNVNHTLNGS